MPTDRRGGSRQPLDLPASVPEDGFAHAVAGDAGDVELAAADHEVEVDRARVHARLVLAVDEKAEAASERDVTRGVLVEQRVEEDRLERTDAALAVDERQLAEPGRAVVERAA